MNIRPSWRLRPGLAASTLLAVVASSALTVSAQAATQLSIGTPRLSLSFENTLVDAATPSNVVEARSPNGGTPSAQYVAGVDGGKALDLGPNTYLDLGTEAGLTPSNMTFSFWLKPDAAMVGEQVVAWSKSAYNSDGFYITSQSNIPLAISAGPGAAQPYQVRVAETSRDAFFPVGQWTHVVVTYDSTTKQAGFYRNGVKVNTSVVYAPGGAATGVIGQSSTIRKTLGFNGPNYNGGWLHSSLDEVQLYAGVAPIDDVVALYEDGGGQVDRAAIARRDADALTVPASTSVDLPLAGVGAEGSRITWTSSDPAVISDTGEVTQPESGEADESVTLTASVSFAGGQPVTRTFAVEVLAVREVLEDSGLEVLVQDEYLQNGLDKEHDYLLSLSSDRFLYWWYRTAGLTPPTASLPANQQAYGGWEGGVAKADGTPTQGNNFRGHAFGHYLSALAMSYANTTDPQTKAALLAQIQDGVTGLKEVQDSYAGKTDQYAGTATGYIAPFRPSAFSAIEGRGTSDDAVIVPYYNIHKVLQGLLDVNKFVPGDVGGSALDIAQGFGDYVGRRMNTLANKGQMRGTEYGGMNEALYELYERVGGDPLVLDAAEAFDDITLFTNIANGNDVLPGRHANTTIPKFIGALKRYTVFTQNPDLWANLTPQEQAQMPLYFNAAQSFFTIVSEGHTYANGSNSQSEHFHEAGTLHEYATQRGTTGNPQTSETCNVFNMLKLARELFKLTRDGTYLDFYENAFTNHIVSSQDPTTGMTTYFQPMAPGYYKLYSMPFTDFWCCVGTGMENFSKVGDSIYYSGEDGPWVAMFWSSRYDHEASNIRLTQVADMPNDEDVTFTVDAIDQAAGIDADATVHLRVPDWAASTPTVKVNDSVVTTEAVRGFIEVDGLSDGDVITYTLPMQVEFEETPDNPDFFAIKYGPMLLSAALDQTAINRASEYTPVGIGVRVPTHKPGLQEVVTVTSASVDAWQADPANVEMIEDTADGQVQFELNGTKDGGSLRFTPHYRQNAKRYGMYLSYETADSAAAQARLLEAKEVQRSEAMTVASLTTFNNNEQAEGLYNLQKGGTTTAGNFNGLSYRDANGAGSFFSYDLPIDPSSAQNVVQTRFYGGDRGRTFQVVVGGQVTTEVIENRNEDGKGFYWETYQIPAGAISPEGKVRVRYQSTGGLVGGVFGVRTSRGTAYDTNPALSGMSATPGTLTPAFDPGVTDYKITVPDGTSEVALDLDPHVASGLVKVDGVLVDDTEARTITVGESDSTAVSIEAFAQDHTTSRLYTVNIVRGEAPVEPEPSTDPSPSPSPSTDPSPQPSPQPQTESPSAPRATTAPQVTGTPKVGRELTASSGAWNVDGVRLSRQWLVDGVPVEGATATTFTVRRKDVGKALSVQVTAASDGRPNGTAVSNEVRAIKASSATKVKTNRAQVRAGDKVTVTVTVRARTAAPSGSVKILDRGRVVKTIALKDGKARIRLVLRKAGVHRIVARYSGNAWATSSRDVIRVRMRG